MRRAFENISFKGCNFCLFGVPRGTREKPEHFVRHVNYVINSLRYVTVFRLKDWTFAFALLLGSSPISWEDATVIAIKIAGLEIIKTVIRCH